MIPTLLLTGVDTLASAVRRDVKLVEWDTAQVFHWLRTGGVRIAMILVLALVALRVVYLIINRINDLADDGDPHHASRREKRAATLTGILRSTAKVVIGGGAAMMVLREFNLDIGPIIAGAGVLGLAVGFGAQSLVKDVIAGFFIILETQFDVGDVVKGAGVQGTVERLNLRFTQLRDLQGEVHFIPNGEFRVVSNLTRGWSRAVVDIAVAYNADLEQVLLHLRAVAAELTEDPRFAELLIEPPEILGVESLAESAVNIRTFLKSRPGKQHDLAREFRKRVKERFEAQGIEIPFPQRSIRISYPDSETAPKGPIGPKA